MFGADKRNQRYKLSISLILSIFSVALIAVNYTDSIFPVLPAAILVISPLVLYISKYRLSTILAIIILISVCLRLGIFSYPTGLVGIDPAKVEAIRVQRVMSARNISPIDINFYEDAALFYVLAATWAILGRLSAANSLVLFPIILGISIPLSSGIIASALARCRGDGDRKWVLNLSVFLTTIAGTTLQYSYWPIAQSLGVVYFSLAVVLVIFYISGGDARFSLLLVIFIISAAYTHKLPVIVLLLSIAVAVVIHTTRNLDRSASILAFPALFTIIVATLQWSFITDYIAKIIVKVMVTLTTEGASASPKFTMTAATEVLSGILGTLYRRGHAITILIFSGLFWIIALRKSDTLRASVALGASAVTVSFIGLAIYAPSQEVIPPLRALFMAEFLLIALISASLLKYERRGIVYAFIALIVVSQLASPVAAPDSYKSPRFYLTDSEIAGKDFTFRYVNEGVHTDLYASYYNTPTMINSGGGNNQFKELNEGLYNASLIIKIPPYVLYRHRAEVYLSRLQQYKLLWRPEIFLSKNSNKIYDSGSTALYHNTKPPSRFTTED